MRSVLSSTWTIKDFHLLLLLYEFFACLDVYALHACLVNQVSHGNWTLGCRQEQQVLLTTGKDLIKGLTGHDMVSWNWVLGIDRSWSKSKVICMHKWKQSSLEEILVCHENWTNKKSPILNLFISRKILSQMCTFMWAWNLAWSLVLVLGPCTKECCSFDGELIW